MRENRKLEGKGSLGGTSCTYRSYISAFEPQQGLPVLVSIKLHWIKLAQIIINPRLSLLSVMAEIMAQGWVWGKVCDKDWFPWIIKGDHREFNSLVAMWSTSVLSTILPACVLSLKSVNFALPCPVAISLKSDWREWVMLTWNRFVSKVDLTCDDLVSVI